MGSTPSRTCPALARIYRTMWSVSGIVFEYNGKMPDRLGQGSVVLTQFPSMGIRECARHVCHLAK